MVKSTVFKIKGKAVKYCVTKLSSQSINKLQVQAILIEAHLLHNNSYKNYNVLIKHKTNKSCDNLLTTIATRL